MVKVAEGGYVSIYIYILYISGYKWSTTQSAQISQKQDERIMYVIMNTMCPPGYHHNVFVVTHALGHIIFSNVE